MKEESSDDELNVTLVLIQTRALGLRHKMKQAVQSEEDFATLGVCIYLMGK